MGCGCGRCGGCALCMGVCVGCHMMCNFHFNSMCCQWEP